MSPPSLKYYPKALHFFGAYHYVRNPGVLSVSAMPSSEEVAWEYAKEIDEEDLRTILNELHDLARHLSTLLTDVRKAANITLRTPEEAQKWLESITAIFQQEWDWRHLSRTNILDCPQYDFKHASEAEQSKKNSGDSTVEKQFNLATEYSQGAMMLPEKQRIVAILARNDANRMEQILDDFFEDKIGAKDVSNFFYELLDKRSPLHVLFSFSAPLLEILKELSRDFAFYDPDLFLQAPDVSHDEEELRRVLTRFQETWQGERWLVVRPLLLQIRHWIQLHLQGLLPAIQLRPLVEDLDRDAPPLLSFLTYNPPLHDAMERFLLDLSLFEPSALKRVIHHKLLDEVAVQASARKCFDVLRTL